MFIVRQLGRRLLFLAGTFLAVSLLLFLAIRAIPGDPVALRLKNPTLERVAEERERLGLDRPWTAQYLDTVKQFWKGDWGESLVSGRRVIDEVSRFFPATLELTFFALLIGVLAGTVLGLLAEILPGRTMRAAAFSVGMTGLTIPIFWIGLLMIVTGSLWLGWFPPGGRVDMTVDLPADVRFVMFRAVLSMDPQWIRAGALHLAMPALCLSLYPAAQVCTVLRARLQDSRVRALTVALKAKGVSTSRIWLVHMLRLTGAPVVTVIGTTFGALLGGAVLTETVFSWPGMGRFLVQGVLDRDIFVIQYGLLFIILLVMTVVYVSDLLALMLNPKTRRGHES